MPCNTGVSSPLVQRKICNQLGSIKDPMSLTPGNAFYLYELVFHISLSNTKVN